MSDHEYSQGICGDGVAILKDGQPMTIEEIVDELQKGQAARATGSASVADFRAEIRTERDPSDELIETLYEALKEVVDSADGAGWDQISPGLENQEAAIKAYNKWRKNV